jgi:hypothetical protein
VVGVDRPSLAGMVWRGVALSGVHESGGLIIIISSLRFSSAVIWITVCGCTVLSLRRGVVVSGTVDSTAHVPPRRSDLICFFVRCCSFAVGA